MDKSSPFTKTENPFVHSLHFFNPSNSSMEISHSLFHNILFTDSEDKVTCLRSQSKKLTELESQLGSPTH